MDQGVFGGEGAVAPLGQALDQVATSVDQLIKVVEDGCGDLDNAQLVQVMIAFEQARKGCRWLIMD